MRIGSLCTGIAGLELGLQYAGIETKPVFVSDIAPGPCEWLEQAMPYTPNLGDFTELNELPEVDIITAGFPCQPVSTAGLRKGIKDERWLFDDICRLVSRMDSRPVLWLENVSGILTANSGDAMGRVVYGLADIGYHITWGTLPASAVGAPHYRNRWWGLATAADDDGVRLQGVRRLNPVERNADRRNGERTRSRAAVFGGYWPAVARWERILGRPAPDPTVTGRLNPAFCEWMLGYPEGWVTDILTNRTDLLKIFGNAVVPQAAAEAFLQLSTR